MNNNYPFFDEAWLISLQRRKDRRSSALKSCADVGIYPHIFPAFDGKLIDVRMPNSVSLRWGNKKKEMISSEACTLLSHMALWQMAYGKGLDSILILEDDVQFTSDFKEEFLNFYNDLPKDWDIICGSTRYSSEPTPISKYVHRHVWTWGTQFVMCSKKAIKILVETSAYIRPLEADSMIFTIANNENLRILGPRKEIVTLLDTKSDIAP